MRMVAINCQALGIYLNEDSDKGTYVNNKISVHVKLL